MEPQIHYARASDGVNIAWYAIGSGAPYVWPSSPVGAGLSGSWRIPEHRAILEGIAQRVTLIVFDPRGFGLSDRHSTDFSGDAIARDLEAVVAAADLGPITLQTFSCGSVPALHFAARHRDRVRALVLLNGVLRGSDMSEGWRRLVRLAAEDWDEAKMLLVRTNEARYASTATLEQAEEAMSRSVSPESFLAFTRAMADWDASEVASDVEAPALVVHYGAPVLRTPLDASTAVR